ncbi:hypothetical protein [Variovorax gossypii]
MKTQFVRVARLIALALCLPMVLAIGAGSAGAQASTAYTIACVGEERVLFQFTLQRRIAGFPLCSFGAHRKASRCILCVDFHPEVTHLAR